jgi:hypothetical protein
MKTAETLTSFSHQTEEFYQDFLNYFLFVKRNELSEDEITDYSITEFAVVEDVMIFYLGHKPSTADYEQLSIIALDDERRDYYMKFANEIIGGLERETNEQNYKIRFKQNYN